MARTPCCEMIGLNRGKWRAEEDDKLVKYIKAKWPMEKALGDHYPRKQVFFLVGFVNIM